MFNRTQERKQLKNVKPGDVITIETSRILSGVGNVACLSNDPESKTICLEFRWTTRSWERIILNYSAPEFKNFHLLNKIGIPAYLESSKKEVPVSDLAKLQKELNEALEKEEYEKVSKLQAQIDKLTKK